MRPGMLSDTFPAPEGTSRLRRKIEGRKNVNPIPVRTIELNRLHC